jgi:hypothetical protein
VDDEQDDLAFQSSQGDESLLLIIVHPIRNRHSVWVVENQDRCLKPDFVAL